MNSLQTIYSILPVLFLVGMGILLRKTNLIQESTIRDFQKLVVSITLPLLLFKAFATMVFEIRYLLIVITVFFACTVVMAVSTKLRSFPGFSSNYSPFLMAGFEAGMLGYAIFGTMYGENSIQNFAVIDLGQVLFVFFVLVTGLEVFQGRQFNLNQTIVNFVKSPVIIGILAGVVFNLFGLYQILKEIDLTSSILSTAEILAGLTTPLVALVIGYGLKFQKGRLALPIQTVLVRLVIWVSLALIFNHLIIHRLLGLDRVFEAAVVLMSILPAPFVVPFYLRADHEQERDYILNTLSLGTVAALIGCIVIGMIY